MCSVAGDTGRRTKARASGCSWTRPPMDVSVGKGSLNWVESGPPENPGTVLDPAVQKHERLNVYRQPNGGHPERPWLPQMQLKTPGKGPRLRGLELGVACGN